jgi:hypothetical protein
MGRPDVLKYNNLFALSMVVFLFLLVCTSCLALSVQRSQSELTEDIKRKIDKLLDGLANEQYRVREAAEKEIANLLLNPKTFDALLPYLKQRMDATKDIEVRVRLGDMKVQQYLDLGITGHLLEQFPDILTQLSSRDSGVREKIAKELGDSKNPDAVKPLVNLLGDADESVRRAAAEALGKTREEKAIEPLTKAISDPEPVVCEAAAEALGKIGEKAVEPLTKALTDRDPKLRSKVACALGKTKEARAVEPLIKMVADADPGVRSAAALALGEEGHQSSGATSQSPQV